MGHLGARPIRVTWFALVLPALLLNYFGQGALILRNPAEVAHPFFHLAPSWMLYPLVALSTAATVIASQAVISGAFSLTSQAVALDEFPRVRILQTSGEEIGQIYIPIINWLLMICCIGLVIGFRSSGNLAGAYGIAVTTTMVITTFLAYFVAREIWGWSLGVCLLVTGGFLIVDVGFLWGQHPEDLRRRLVPVAGRRGGLCRHVHVAAGALARLRGKCKSRRFRSRTFSPASRSTLRCG